MNNWDSRSAFECGTLNNSFEVGSPLAILSESAFAVESMPLSAVDARLRVVVPGVSEDFRSLTTSIYLTTWLKVSDKCFSLGRRFKIIMIYEDDERCFWKEHESNVSRLLPTKALVFRKSCARTFCFFNHVFDKCLDQCQWIDKRIVLSFPASRSFEKSRRVKLN